MSDLNKIIRLQNQTAQDCLFRLGQAKQNKELTATWTQVAQFISKEFPNLQFRSERSCRRHYNRIKNDLSGMEGKFLGTGSMSQHAKEISIELEKQRIRLRAERNALAKTLREESRSENIYKLFEQAIERTEPITYTKETQIPSADKAVVCMLSDIHYGQKFKSPFNEYNTEIAKDRVMKYADNIINTAKINKANNKCVVMLMGDMISGNIHKSIQLQNMENIVNQIIGVSELTACFINRLAESFENIEVYSVGGNHSRTNPDKDKVLRSEHLDDLIPYYCKVKLSNIENVKFYQNEFDPTIISFNLFGSNYIGVHGDLDIDIKSSAARIAQAMDKKVDVMLSGHMHVPTSRFENVFYIQNGCVCGSGDNFTAQKRLYSPPAQTYMLCSSNGVQGIYNCNLK